ncbi:MAG: hypothetical protein JWL96_2537 [Sphingomonas bacterium]|nr:hypothetical protein [Sphingomonas bacterium]
MADGPGRFITVKRQTNAIGRSDMRRPARRMIMWAGILPLLLSFVWCALSAFAMAAENHAENYRSP